ncbi:MAG: ATP-binding protein [Actinobacteria bacterium]|nr:ATP-binding protein [Actinomycetota bacterium]
MGGDADTVAPWEVFADAVLRREALVCRVGHGIPVRDFAGMYVDDADAERILRQLPGLDGPPPDGVEQVVAAATGQVEDARARLHPVAASTSRFGAIAGSARLGRADVETLALVTAVERDPRRQRLVAYLQDSIALPRVTVDLLRRLLPPSRPGALAVGPGSALRRSCLIDVAEEGPWAVWTVAPSPRLSWALVGDDAPDPALPPGTMVAHAGGGAVRVDPILLFVHGADEQTRRDVALSRLAARTAIIGPEPTAPEALDALVREAVVTGAAVVLEVAGELSPRTRARIAVTPHLAWAVLSAAPLPLETMPDRVWNEHAAPSVFVDSARWEQAIGQPDGHGHRLTPTQLALVARATPALDGDPLTAVRRLAAGQLDRLAVHIRPRRDWDDLVLPADQHAALRELAARYRQRDRVYRRWGFRALPSAGLVAVFAGPSGTGKTLAAEVIAGELGLDVYKIDLSAIVSKYIGETEKNLERVFSAAACANVVLFFDEADALFGKRSDVGDAHDRYANIEVSYLLQRLETYDGLVVLATNLQRNMDAAFLRRIHVAVEFGLPDEQARRAIWALSFPPDAPVDDIDVGFLARQFKLSGGSIRNAALAAAFLAASTDQPVGMAHVMHALKREFQKLGRLRTEAEFDRYFTLVQTADG